MRVAPGIGQGPRRVLFALAASALLAGAALAGADTTRDRAELERTWQRAKVYLPALGIDTRDLVTLVGPKGSRVIEAGMRVLLGKQVSSRLPPGSKFPTIIYLHGCAGFSRHNEVTARFLAGAGYAVIQPNSFARRTRPQNCDLETKTANRFRGALAFRLAEAAYALRRARGLSWVDKGNLFLMGHSEGGIAAAKFKGEPVNGRIVEGAGCTYGWKEWSGLEAPESEPVLALKAANDPWDRGRAWRGSDCGPLMSKTNGSRSYVFAEPSLANRHGVAHDPRVQAIILAFLERNRKKRAVPQGWWQALRADPNFAP